MKLVLTAGLTATTLVLGTGPALAAPYDWHETPIGVKALLPYSISSGGGALWTVGATDDTRNFRPVAAQWVGGLWKTTPQPVAFGRLLDVAVDGPTNAWAAGAQETPYQARLLLQHWNGKAWKEVVAPTFTDKENREFYTVATQGGQVWAAGHGPGADGLDAGIVYRYDGKKWTSVNDAVSAASSFIYDIAPLASDNVWIAAENGVKHFDGRRWRDAALPSPDIHLRGLAVKSSKDIWAVGHREDPQLWRRPVAYHYDGKAWTEVATPAETGELDSVSLVNGQPVAVGESPSGPYIVRMTGTGFVREADPAGAGTLLSSTVSAGRLWIAGWAATGGDVPDPYVANTSSY